MKNSLLLASIFLLNSCHVGRYFTRNFANITDHKIFLATEINTSDEKFYFKDGTQSEAAQRIEKITLKKKGEERLPLSEYLDQLSKTVSFLVIKNDSILFEHYYEGYEQNTISNIFSASKSVTSLLVGIALDEGKIKNVNDVVTDYLPEFKSAHPYFQKLTIQQLLDMRAGFDFKESYSTPFADVAKLYYGTNQIKQLLQMGFDYEPGTHYEYQSGVTSMLGVIVERVTGKSMGTYLEEKIWKPMGMEHSASWSYDDKKHQSTKAFCCLNTTAIDLAKIGRLYLNNGMWNGKQIISKKWIEAASQPNLENDGYQNQWYSRAKIAHDDGKEMFYADSLSAVKAGEGLGVENFYVDKKTNSSSSKWHIHYYEDYYALGILGQFLYLSPEDNLIIVRLGEKWKNNYWSIFDAIKKVTI